MKLFWIILFIAIPAGNILAQQNDLMRDILMSKKAERDRNIEAAYEQTLAGNYKEADDLYLILFQDGEAIPSDLCFYFGKNSYHLDKHHQSIDWLNKYIELKGTEGVFFNEAKELIELNKEELQKLRVANRENTESVMSQNYDLDCGPAGKVRCPVCQGETVIINKTPFGKSYQTCTYCDKDGNMTCDNYNKLLKGEL